MTPARIPVLMADDDEDDRLLALEAFEAADVSLELRFVADGEELLRYLRREGVYTDPTLSPKPCLILLDLNMPVLGGYEALARLKADPVLKAIDVVVLTTSRADRDVAEAYRLGATRFLTKPVEFGALVELARSLRGLAEAGMAAVAPAS